MVSLLVAAAVAATPAQAPAPDAVPHTVCHHHTHLLTRYSRLWHDVRRLHGPRAPGRNIRAQGLSKGHPSKCGDIVRSATVLHRMRYPGSTLLRPSQPRVPPAGTATLRATSWPLTAIKACESGGNYGAVNPNGHYGAYQFDKDTWQSVGGSGKSGCR
jgi:hypothetical protein